MQKNEKKNKHMTLDDRMEVQECLEKSMTFKAIGRRIGKDPTTVSKEVKLHAQKHTNSFTKTDEICPKLLKAPFVCNGCDNRHRKSCIYPHRIYSARASQQEYRTVLVESREGIPLNKEEFYETEKIISSAVKAGQHVYHIIHSNQLPVSKSTVYRHIQRGYYTISLLDLPRAVKFKPRKSHLPDYVPKGIKEGRSYAEFVAYLDDNTAVNVVEMDTVIGRPGGKVIMTFQFTNVDFMFGILLENKTAVEAGDKIALLKQHLAQRGFSFGTIIPVLLTDNGGEFSNVFAFENDSNGNKETSVFFCNPNSPYQKPHVENNHTLFRCIVPSGKSFDSFTQETVDLIFSHVNAVKRKQFNAKSSYDLFAYTYSQALANALGISYVDPKKVIQSPQLLDKSVLK